MHLYMVRPDEEQTLIPEEQAPAFHCTTAQFLFLSERACPDMQIMVSFPTKRVQSPDKDDWGKKKRGLIYLRGKMHMKLNTTVDSLSAIWSYVDSSYGV